MEFHQLEYFLALEKYLSFSEAAESICISQPTLSYQIKKLEKELGTELFIRSTRNVQLTPAGAEFLKYAKRILLDIQTSKSVMLDHTNLTKGSIRIGALRLITNLGITSIIADFIKKYPGIKIQIHQGNTDVLLTKMHRGEIDVAFITTPFKFDHEFTFYPLIKDKKVSGNQSFRDILLSYCKEENELSQIEQSLPLLNIMVPDLTLFWDFNATTWDTSDKEISVLCRDDKNNTLYENGENIGNMTNGDIPGFPCLVVKNNERMKITSVNTRSGEATYEFISDAFDGSKKVQTRHYDADNDLEATEDLNKYVSKDVVATAINAWREFKNVPNACQRDYIYYGINKTNTPGSLNRNIREKLYRFRISATAFGRIADADGDQRLQDLTQTKRYLSNEEILQNIWTDGNFEFRFKSYIAGETNKDAMEHLLTFSVKAKDVFSIEKIHLHHKNGTAFRQSKNFYSVDINNLRSKWIYPEKLEPNKDNQVFTLPWDLYNKALSIHMYVEEFDVDQTIEKT